MQFKTITRKITCLPPKEGQSSRKIAIDIDDTTGLFSCKIPKDVISLIGVNPGLADTTLSGLTHKLDAQLEKYELAVQMSLATQVIVVNYRVKCADNTPFGLRNDFDERSTDPLPLNIIGFDYEVLLKIGDRLYSQEFEGAPLHYEGTAKTDPNRMILDWSAQSEAMFVQMTARMEQMIEQLNEFFSPDTIAENVAAALAGQTRPLLTSLEE